MRIESFLRQSPIFHTGSIARRMDVALTRVLGQEGLTLFESLILTAIFFEKNRCVKPSDLAETFQTTRGNVSHCLSSLEAAGLIRRRIDPEDARAFQLSLQPAGKKRAARVAGILDRMQSQFEAAIGPVALKSMLEHMATVEEVCSSVAAAEPRLPK